MRKSDWRNGIDGHSAEHVPRKALALHWLPLRATPHHDKPPRLAPRRIRTFPSDMRRMDGKLQPWNSGYSAIVQGIVLSLHTRWMRVTQKLRGSGPLLLRCYSRSKCMHCTKLTSGLCPSFFTKRLCPREVSEQAYVASKCQVGKWTQPLYVTKGAPKLKAAHAPIAF